MDPRRKRLVVLHISGIDLGVWGKSGDDGILVKLRREANQVKGVTLMLAPWTIEEMNDADLKDKRLNKRLTQVLAQLSGHPTASPSSTVQCP